MENPAHSLDVCRHPGRGGQSLFRRGVDFSGGQALRKSVHELLESGNIKINEIYESLHKEMPIVANPAFADIVETLTFTKIINTIDANVTDKLSLEVNDFMIVENGPNHVNPKREREYSVKCGFKFVPQGNDETTSESEEENGDVENNNESEVSEQEEYEEQEKYSEQECDELEDKNDENNEDDEKESEETKKMFINI